MDAVIFMFLVTLSDKGKLINRQVVTVVHSRNVAGHPRSRTFLHIVGIFKHRIYLNARRHTGHTEHIICIRNSQGS